MESSNNGNRKRKRRMTTWNEEAYYAIGQIESMIYEINHDTKPVAHKNVHKIVIYSILIHLKKYLEDQKIECYISRGYGKQYHLYFYKYSHLLKIIKQHEAMASMLSQKDKTIYHWFSGKMFGYAESMIGEFINKQ